MKPQPDTHTPAHKRTQYAHTHAHTQNRYKIHTYTDTEYTEQNNMQHTEQNNTEYREQQYAAHRTEYRIHRTEQHRCRTENNTEPQRTYTTQSCTHSFDFYHLQQYIKKLYNIAIYEFYTFCSPYL